MRRGQGSRDSQVAGWWWHRLRWRAGGLTLCHRLFHREPDSTYFDLPPPNHTGSNEVSNRTEVTMDVFQMRSMDDSVMVSVLRLHAWELRRTQTSFPCGGLGALWWGLGRSLVRTRNTGTPGAVLLPFVRGLMPCARWLRCGTAAGRCSRP